MDTLNAVLRKHLDELPRILLVALLEKKFSRHHIKPSKRRCLKIADKILNDGQDEFKIDGVGLKGCKRNLTIKFTERDLRWLERRANKFADKLPNLISSANADISKKILAKLKRKWAREYSHQLRDNALFKKRLESRWRLGLEKLRMLITVAKEFGHGLNVEARKLVDADSRKTFDILMNLHARSCQVAEEIVCLLSNGFADGAMARWRTLHEIAAVARLIQLHGDDIAERYQNHQIVESRKAAIQFQKFHKRLKQRPLSERMLQEIEQHRTALAEKYGEDFLNPQGWAASHVGKRNPTIFDIQEAAGIDHLAPYYRLASHNVHANPKGVFSKLGLLGGDNILLAGPSNAGLADPGHATAISLVTVSGVLLNLCSTLDNQVTVGVMNLLEEEIGQALLAAHRKLKSEAKLFNKTR